MPLPPHFTDPAAARSFLEAARWPAGPVCPHCLASHPYPLVPGPHSSTRPGLWKCAACRRQFSVLTRTILERTHLPLPLWLRALDLLCTAPAGLVPVQLAVQLDISSRSACALAHRLQDAIAQGPLRRRLRPAAPASARYRLRVRLYPLSLAEATSALLQVPPARRLGSA